MRNPFTEILKQQETKKKKHFLDQITNIRAPCKACISEKERHFE